MDILRGTLQIYIVRDIYTNSTDMYTNLTSYILKLKSAAVRFVLFYIDVSQNL